MTINAHRLFSLAVVAIALVLTLGCGAGNNSNVQPHSTDVYAAGFEQNDAGYEVAKYWKNGTPIVLTTGTNGSYANSIAVSGSDVYVAGIEGNGTNDVAKYWKNGVPVELTDGTQRGYANSIFVDGSDVYVAGGEMEPGVTLAKYWKNGVPVDLKNGEIAQSILVSGADVYVSGWRYKTTQIDSTHSVVNPVAMFWKNGTPTELTDGLKPALAFSIFVSGPDVYVGGYACQTMDSDCAIATYWKNGTAVPLTATTNSDVVSMFVSGTDVYAIGNQSNNLAEFWKNGVLTPLTRGSMPSGANQIVVSGSDVYVGGAEIGSSGQGMAGYWNNGLFVPLTDGTHFASAFGLAVVTHQHKKLGANVDVRRTDSQDRACEQWTSARTICRAATNGGSSVVGEIWFQQMSLSSTLSEDSGMGIVGYRWLEKPKSSAGTHIWIVSVFKCFSIFRLESSYPIHESRNRSRKWVSAVSIQPLQSP